MTTILLPTPMPVFRAFSGTGQPLAGGLLYTYAGGTTTPQATYTDNTGGSPNANPVVLDSTGSAPVFLGAGLYKLILKDSAGNIQWTEDNIQGGGYVSSAMQPVVQAASVGAALTLLGGVTAAQVSALIAAAFAPSGAVQMYGGSTSPLGFLECDGSAVSRTTYAALFAAIGTSYGVGNGTTTFNVPDMRGYFARGWDHGAGVDTGRTLGSTQANALQSFTASSISTVTDPTHAHTAPSRQSGSDGGAYTAASNNPDGTAAINPASTGISVATATTYTGSETRPINLTFMYIIKT